VSDGNAMAYFTVDQQGDVSVRKNLSLTQDTYFRVSLQYLAFLFHVMCCLLFIK